METNSIESKEFLDRFEHSLHDNLAKYLYQRGAIDKILPDAPDIEERWEKICVAYLPDGVREFNDYPTASLGWMMFIGMAVAQMWDEDWEMYSQFNDLYAILVKGRGYDCMDEYICYDIMKLDEKATADLSKLVGDTAELVHNALRHEEFEPGTPSAFNAYVRCLHQLYYFGSADRLSQLGYRMTELPC